MRGMSFECPNCTAPLEYEPGKQVMYCPYCGAKVLKDDIDFYQEDSKNARLETFTDSVVKIVGTKEQRDQVRREKEEARQKALDRNRKAIPFEIGFFVILFGVLLLLEHYGLI